LTLHLRKLNIHNKYWVYLVRYQDGEKYSVV
jgi:hypothetical protein